MPARGLEVRHREYPPHEIPFLGEAYDDWNVMVAPIQIVIEYTPRYTYRHYTQRDPKSIEYLYFEFKLCRNT